MIQNSSRITKLLTCWATPRFENSNLISLLIYRQTDRFKSTVFSSLWLSHSTRIDERHVVVQLWGFRPMKAALHSSAKRGDVLFQIEGRLQSCKFIAAAQTRFLPCSDNTKVNRNLLSNGEIILPPVWISKI